jgi:hypothetical protein
MAGLESEKNPFSCFWRSGYDHAKNHSDPKMKSKVGHMDNSDFFHSRKCAQQRNFIIFVLLHYDLDSLHDKLPQYAVKGRILNANYWELESTWTFSVRTVLAWSYFFLEIISNGFLIRGLIRTRDCLSRGFTFQNFRLFNCSFISR